MLTERAIGRGVHHQHVGRAEPDPAHRTLYDDLYERYQALLGSRVVR